MTEQDAQPLKKPKPIDGSGPSIVEAFNDYSERRLTPQGDSGDDIPAALETRGVVGFDHYYEWLRDEFVWPRDVRRQFLDKVREFEAAGQAFSLTYANLDGEPRPVEIAFREADLGAGRPLPVIAMVGPGPG